jgi:uncharacterized protein
MTSITPHKILDNIFLLSSNKTVYWEAEKILILSDLHLGKTGHFRKAGIAVPQTILQEDLFRLLAAIQFHKPDKIIIVGDLFHSHANKEHDLFLKFRKDTAYIDIHLVMGNHDILHNDFYEKANVVLHRNLMEVNDFIFAHDINEIQENKTKYCFSGHVHPSIQIQGTGRQSLKLPCFYFTKNYAVLPAFGKFTGTFSIKKKKGDDIFAIVENNILKV